MGDVFLIYRVISTLAVLGGILFIIQSIFSAKRLTRFALVFRLFLGVIGIFFGLIGLFCSPSSRSCFVAYSLLVFLFFGTSFILFLRRGGGMNILDFGAYAGIVGGIIYLFLLFAFRDSFAGRGRVSWVIQLEMAIFMVLMGFLAWGTRNGSIPSAYLGAAGWIWLAVVIVTVLLWFGRGSKA